MANIYAYKSSSDVKVVGIGHLGNVDASQLPRTITLKIEFIVDKRVITQTKRGTYYGYMIKWKDYPIEDATWMSESEIEKEGYKLEYIPTQGT